MAEYITIYKVPITLHWDSDRAFNRDTRQSGQWSRSGSHRVANKITRNGLTVYAIDHPDYGYTIGWVRADDLGGTGLNETDELRYTVKSGDSLWKISTNHGVTVNDLRAWNGIVGDLIHPGQSLIVRQGKKEIIEEVEDEIISIPQTPLSIEIDGKVIPLVEGINANLFELPVGVTKAKLIGKGNIKVRYRPEVMG